MDEYKRYESNLLLAEWRKVDTSLTLYSGPDKLVGTLVGTLSPSIPVQYWEEVKTMDIQRWGNVLFINIDSENQEYIGFGRESWNNSVVKATFYLTELNSLGIADEDTLEDYLGQFHVAVNQYSNSSQADSINGYPIVWVKITDEKREEELRGIILYEITLEVRSYIGPGST